MIKFTYDFSALEKENDISFYLLGAFCTDGCVILQPRNKGSVVLATKDHDWADKINSFIAPNKPIIKQSKYSRIEWHSIHIANWFIAHGCVPKKSLSLKFPKISVKFLPDFIRGCWDGDGTLGVYPRKRKDGTYYGVALKSALTTGSRKFATGLKQKLAILNIRSSIYERELPVRTIGTRIITKQSKLYIVEITDKKSMKIFCDVIYYPKNRIAMPRKYSIVKEILKNI